MSFATKLKKLRKDKGLTQKELGVKIGKSARVISYYENEENGTTQPKFEFIQSISNYFGVPISYFDETSKEKSKYEKIVEILTDLSADSKLQWIKIVPEENFYDLNGSDEIQLIYSEIKNKDNISIMDNVSYISFKEDVFNIVFHKDNVYYLFVGKHFYDRNYSEVNYKYFTEEEGLISKLYNIIESPSEIEEGEFYDSIIETLSYEKPVEENTNNYVDYDDVPF